MRSVIILVKSPDQKGLVSKITTYFYKSGFNILDCQQHADLVTGDFFMRLKLDFESSSLSLHELEDGFQKIAKDEGLTWSAHFSDKVERVAILVSKTSHCLYDLLVRSREGELGCDIPIIISNHNDLSQVAEQFGIPYCHLPVTVGTQKEQESKILEMLKEYKVGLVVLARYMRILSPSFLNSFDNRIINIHHAFLPAFQGAKPYHRAYERGVKMIGATAHYVTEELDEGPIIEQDVQRVTHENSPADMQRIGRDIERVVLARAVKADLEHRVIVSGRRVIVFSGGR